MSLSDVAVVAIIIAGLVAFGATLKWLSWPTQAHKSISDNRRSHGHARSQGSGLRAVLRPWVRIQGL